jgi:hypothetical protein
MYQDLVVQLSLATCASADVASMLQACLLILSNGCVQCLVMIDSLAGFAVLLLQVLPGLERQQAWHAVCAAAGRWPLPTGRPAGAAAPAAAALAEAALGLKAASVHRQVTWC